MITPEHSIWNEPFCPYAEVHQWIALTQALEDLDKNGVPTMHNLEAINSYSRHQAKGKVYWKAYKDPTGICLSGDYAGRLVKRTIMGVWAFRFMTVNGGHFEADQVSHRVNSLAISDVHRTELTEIVSRKGEFCFPYLIAKMCSMLGLLNGQIEIDAFIQSIFQQNLMYPK